MSIYRATLVRVIDGDTIDVRVDLRHGLLRDVRVRIAGVAAPEVRGVESEWGIRAETELMYHLAAHNPEGKLTLIDWGDADEDAFGRWLCTVKVGDLDVGAELIRQGYAVPYERRHEIDWSEVEVYPLEEPWEPPRPPDAGGRA